MTIERFSEIEIEECSDELHRTARVINDMVHFIDLSPGYLAHLLLKSGAVIQQFRQEAINAKAKETKRAEAGH